MFSVSSTATVTGQLQLISWDILSFFWLWPEFNYTIVYLKGYFATNKPLIRILEFQCSVMVELY